MIKHFPVDFIEVVSQTALISTKEIERNVVYHHSNVLYKSSQTHHPNQDTSVIRDIFRVANKSRKPPDDFSPSTGASNGSWGISFLLNRAISARPFSACSILPFTRSHLGDSGINLWVINQVIVMRYPVPDPGLEIRGTGAVIQTLRLGGARSPKNFLALSGIRLV